MGVQGLKKLLAFALKEIHLQRYLEQKNYTVAVDASNWIYAGYSGFDEKDSRVAIQQKVQSTAMYVERNIKKISSTSKILLVFDGDRPKLKESTIKKRQGGMPRHVKEMVHEKIRELCRKKKNVTIVTAPEEADAQMAHLVRSGHADFCLTLDSDMFLYGVKFCLSGLAKDGVKNFLKMEECLLYEGVGYLQDPGVAFPRQIMNQNQLLLLDVVRRVSVQEAIEVILKIALLVGTDYNPGGVPGLGLAKSVPLVCQMTEYLASAKPFFNSAIKTAKLPKKLRQSLQGHLEEIEKAELGLKTTKVRNFCLTRSFLWL